MSGTKKPSAWTASQFTARVADPSSGRPVERLVAGWVSEHWALDFRVFDVGDAFETEYRSGWSATHLGTGYHAFAFLMPLTEAQAAADYVNGLCDWSFTDPVQARNIVGVAPKVLEKFGDDVTLKPSSFGPTAERRSS